MKRLLIVDDEEAIVELIEPVFPKEDFLVFTATDCETAIGIAEKEPIDVMIVDYVIPHSPGRHILNFAKESLQKPIVLTITGFENIEAREAFEFDIHAFLRKPFKEQDIYATVKRLIELFKKPSAPAGLSKRENEILQYVVSGLTSKEIAQKCFISVRTVEKHRENIMKRLDCRNSVELVTKFSHLIPSPR